MSERVRRITIPRARLHPWLDGFAARHGQVTAEQVETELIMDAEDGARAWIEIPFPPATLSPDDLAADLITHVTTDRRVGCLLLRKGGYAVGIFEGETLITSKVGSSYVQGKTKAGGWSQQRYARRRDNQSKKAYAAAADQAARLIAPAAADLAAVINGGDAPAVTQVLEDPRLAALRSLAQPRVLPVSDPRLRVLQAFPEQFLAITIDLNDRA